MSYLSEVMNNLHAALKDFECASHSELPVLAVKERTSAGAELTSAPVKQQDLLNILPDFSLVFSLRVLVRLSYY